MNERQTSIFMRTTSDGDHERIALIHGDAPEDREAALLDFLDPEYADDLESLVDAAIEWKHIATLTGTPEIQWD